MYNGVPKCVDRWRLEGSLITKVAMHIGDGDTLPMEQRVDPNNDLFESLKAADPGYATVFMGVNGPMIPGTALKGALRAWATAHGVDESKVKALFGTLKQGSSLTVHDAALSPPPAAVWDATACFWSATRHTAISSHAVIDPVSRTSREGLLYYEEYVPAATRFQVTFTAQSLSEESRQLLLWILAHAFCSPERPARLGGNTANGWGEVKWEPGKVAIIKADEIAKWLNNQMRPSHWMKGLRWLEGRERVAWLQVPDEEAEKATLQSVTLNLTLSFSGPVLTNDPARQRRVTKASSPIGRVTIRKENGDYYLPSRSVRGAFRAQARRIWQTIALETSGPAGLDLRHVNEEQEMASRNGGEKRLSPFHKLMGSGGWKSPLEFSDFTLRTELTEPKEHLQHFVAIDRFTGGVAGEKKFQAAGLMRPVFSGKITIYQDRLGKSGAGDWVWLLLLFILRDWVEGDGSLGFGASKGYGAFQANVAAWGPEPATLLAAVLRGETAALADPRLLEWERALELAMGRAA